MKFTQLLNEKGSIIRKMMLNQFAFSLFGIFVATPFSGNICIFAGVFSLLFYLFVVGFAILDDAQKDRIAFNAGRKPYLNAFVGMKYAYISFIPGILLTALYTVLSFVLKAGNTFTFILGIINKYALSGEILGIDVGLTNYTYDAINNIRVSTAPEAVIFMSQHGIFQIIFALAIPALCGLIYYLGYAGIVSVNTTESSENK